MLSEVEVLTGIMLSRCIWRLVLLRINFKRLRRRRLTVLRVDHERLRSWRLTRLRVHIART